MSALAAEIAALTADIFAFAAGIVAFAARQGSRFWALFLIP